MHASEEILRARVPSGHTDKWKRCQQSWSPFMVLRSSGLDCHWKVETQLSPKTGREFSSCVLNTLLGVSYGVTLLQRSKGSRRQLQEESDLNRLLVQNGFWKIAQDFISLNCRISPWIPTLGVPLQRLLFISPTFQTWVILDSSFPWLPAPLSCQVRGVQAGSASSSEIHSLLAFLRPAPRLRILTSSYD